MLQILLPLFFCYVNTLLKTENSASYFYVAIDLPVNIPDNPAGDNFYPSFSCPGFLFAPGMTMETLVYHQLF